MPEKEPSFLDVIFEAQNKKPSRPEQSDEYDIPQMFQRKEGSPLVQAEESLDALGLQIKCISHTKVYTLWRDWATCPRCKDAVKSGAISLPEVGDYECPHTQVIEFKEVLDKCLKGKYGLYKQEFFTLKTGVRCAHLTWLEVDPEHIKQMEKAQKFREDNQVYPPNLAKAFADPVDEAKKRAAGSKN